MATHLQVEVANFESIRSVSLSLKPGLNILVGPNAAGKTCICSALAFLHDLLLRGVAQAIAHAGGPKRAYHRKRTEIRFRVVLDYGQRIWRNKRCPCSLDWQIRISQTGPDRIATIVHEHIAIYAEYGGRKVLVFRVKIDRPKGESARFRSNVPKPHEFGHDLFSYWEEETRRTKERLHKMLKTHVGELARGSRASSDRSLLARAGFLDDRIGDILRLFTGLNEYNIVPDLARAPSEQLPFAVMKPNGEGVAQVIHALEQGDYHKIQLTPTEDFSAPPYYQPIRRRRYRVLPYPRWPGVFYPGWTTRLWGSRSMSHRLRLARRKSGPPMASALENIQRELSAGVRPIVGITTDIDQTTGKRFLVFKAPPYKFYPQEVSDGTIKWLCILVSIYVPITTIYVLEEPENFLHPWMQQRLIATMREKARENDTIFLLTTHSTTVLNSARPDEILVVTPSSKGTQVREISNKKEIERVLKESDFRLGDLWVSGAIEGVPSYEG